MCKPGMGSGCPHKTAKAVGILALRLALAVVFIYAGWDKLGANHAMVAGMMGSLGLPGSGSFWAYLVGGLEVLGGVMLLLGVWVRVAVIWLAFFMLVALYTMRGQAFYMLFTPIVVLGGLLSLLGTGAGKYRLIKSECCCKDCKMTACACGKSDCPSCGTKKDGGCCGGACGGSCGDKKM